MKGNCEIPTETSSHCCFLCPEDVEDEHYISRQRSLRTLCRYLKTNSATTLFSHAKGPAVLKTVDQLLSQSEEEVKVTLCQKCFQLYEKFAKHFRQLEKVRMELDYSLESIYARMKEAGDGDKRISSHFNNDAVVEGMRKQIMRNCLQKFCRDQPRVRLPKLTLEEEAKRQFQVAPVGGMTSAIQEEPELEDPSMEMDIGEVKVESFFPRSSWTEDQNSYQPVMESQEGKSADQDKSQKNLPDLNGHLTKCNLCGKQFSNPSNCQSHHRSVHLGVRFKCQICCKTFSRKNILRKHHRQACHAGGGPLVSHLNNLKKSRSSRRGRMGKVKVVNGSKQPSQDYEDITLSSLLASSPSTAAAAAYYSDAELNKIVLGNLNPLPNVRRSRSVENGKGLTVNGLGGGENGITQPSITKGVEPEVGLKKCPFCYFIVSDLPTHLFYAHSKGNGIISSIPIRLPASGTISVNPVTRKISCSSCSNGFSTGSGVQCHYKTVDLEVRYKCAVCGSGRLQKVSITVRVSTWVTSSHAQFAFKCLTVTLV